MHRIYHFIVLLLLIPIIIYALLYYSKIDGINFGKQEYTQPMLVKERSVAESITENHPDLFFVDLSYILKNDFATQLGTGKANGDPPIYFLEHPKPAQNIFIYKVEVVSDNNELIQQGWKAASMLLAKKNAKDKLLFRVTTLYKKNAIIKIYTMDNKLIWTGIIK